VYAILAVALLGSGEAKAYQLRAFENSFLGANSTSEPFVNWSRYREGNGSAIIDITSSGTRGEVEGVLSLQRVFANESSIASETYRFTAQIEENVRPVTSAPPGSIVRLTMAVDCTGHGFRTPPPFGNSGNAFVTLDTRLGVSGVSMIGTSRRDFINDWSATTNIDSAAVESSFVLSGGLIRGLTYAARRGSGSQPSYYFGVYVSGEATAGTFFGAQAIARARARVKFMMEVSTNNGVDYIVVPWLPVNTNFLSGVQPQLSFSQLNLTNQVGVTGLPLGQHQLQVAPTPVGPWTNLGGAFMLPNLEPVVVPDPEPNVTRFYRTRTAP
jgi:hypothetical protein